MNEELDLNIENEGKPGGLNGAFDAFSPDLPAGSWERLADRRRKRRRFLLWWWMSGLLPLFGIAIWFFSLNHGRETKMNPSEIMVLQPKNLPEKRESSPVVKVPKTDTESLGIRASTTDKKVNAISTGSPKSTTPQEKRGALKQAAVLPEIQQSFQKETISRTPHHRPEPNQKTQKKGIGMEIEPATLQVTKVAKAAKRSSGEGKTQGPKMIGQPKITPSFSSNRKPNTYTVPEPVIKVNENQLVEEIEKVQGKITPPLNSGKDENRASSTPTLQTKVEATALADSVQAMASPVLDSAKKKSPESPPIEALIPDSSKEKPRTNPRFGFEIGFSVAVVNQEIVLKAQPLIGTEKTVQEISQARPLWGGNFQCKVRIPVAKRWTILPLAELSVLSQSVQYLESAGPTSPVKLTKTATGIVGTPGFTEQRTWRHQWLYLPATGLEANYQVSERFGVRLGSQWAWIFSGSKGSNPALSNPVYQAAMQYQIRKRWCVRLEMRQFKMKSLALPQTSSRSQNLQFGLGLVWKPW